MEVCSPTVSINVLVPLWISEQALVRLVNDQCDVAGVDPAQLRLQPAAPTSKYVLRAGARDSVGVHSFRLCVTCGRHGTAPIVTCSHL